MLWVDAVVLSLLALAQGAPIPPNPPRVGWDSETAVPVVPPEFRSIITGATREKLTVRSLDGRSIPVAISGYNVWDYRLYQNGRYFGMRLSGYEVVGYLLVDRAARTGNVIETGKEPLFSDDGHWFAVAGLTDADQGNFEGIGLWEVGPTSSTRRFFTNAVPLSSGWRTDRWIGNCVAFSAFTTKGSGYYPSEEPNRRHNYGLWVKPGITLEQSGSDPPCDESKRP
jgi:hypothetical protein